MKRVLFLLSAGVMGLLLMASPAKADDVFITLCENGFGCKMVASGTTSAVFSGKYGTYTLTLDTGFSNAFDRLDGDASQEVGVGGPLVVYVTGTGFINGGTPQQFTALFGGTIVGSGTIYNYTYLDNGNGVCGQGSSPATGTTFAACTPGTLLTSMGPFTTGIFSDMAHAAANAVAPYSLTEAISISLTRGSTAHSLDGTITVPEPASLALTGSGMLLLGGFLRRRLKGVRGSM